jgi:hypothetical protein
MVRGNGRGSAGGAAAGAGAGAGASVLNCGYGSGRRESGCRRLIAAYVARWLTWRGDKCERGDKCDGSNGTR